MRPLAERLWPEGCAGVESRLQLLGVGRAGVPKLVDESGDRLRCAATDGSETGCARLARYPDHRCAHHTAWLAGTRNERDAADRSQAGSKATLRAWDEFRARARALFEEWDSRELWWVRRRMPPTEFAALCQTFEARLGVASSAPGVHE